MKFIPQYLRKKKVLPASERSVFQLLDAVRLNKQGILNNYKCTAKTYSTMEEKKLFATLCRTFEISNHTLRVDSDKNLFTFYI